MEILICRYKIQISTVKITLKEKEGQSLKGLEYN